MADNYNVTQGSGTVFGSDEVTRDSVAQQLPIVKSALGEDGQFRGFLGASIDSHGLNVLKYDSIASAIGSATGYSLGSNVYALTVHNITDGFLGLSFNQQSSVNFYIPAGQSVTLSPATHATMPPSGTFYPFYADIAAVTRSASSGYVAWTILNGSV